MAIGSERLQRTFDGEPPPPAVAQAPARACVRYASWLSDCALMLVARLPGEQQPVGFESTVVEAEPPILEARCMTYRETRAGSWLNHLLVVRFCEPGDAAMPVRLSLRTADAAAQINATEIVEALCDLKDLLRASLAALTAPLRAQVLDFVLSVVGSPADGARDLRLSTSLFLLREGLRERLPLCVVAADQPQGLSLSTLISADDRTFYVSGWAWDGEAEIAALTAVSPEGSRVELLPSMFRLLRPDIERLYGIGPDEHPKPKPGFVCRFELPAPSIRSRGWVLEMRNTAGRGVEATGPAVIRDLTAARDALLGDLPLERPLGGPLTRLHLHPALQRLQERHREHTRIERVDQYGAPPAAPAVSLVIPLYGRIDFVEHQLAQFVHDPEVQRADIVYVLDSPELDEALEAAATRLFRLYGVPFRMVVLNRNGGFSTATNLGASVARGRLLLLLNSDVLPDAPGWLGRMAAFYDATPRIGALGPKLLYEDDSLQHAGLFFHRPAGARLWSNMHYFKGLHRSLPAANVTREVPGVTGACLMIDTALYQRLGGLHGAFVQGDFEDSDLCLRLHDAGYSSWYLPEAELYHLEGQSYPVPLRQLTARYNAWLHTELWNDAIVALMARFPS